MTRLIVLLLGLTAGTHAALAQQTSCKLFEVTTGLLNIAKTAAGTEYVDILEQGDIACVVRQETASGGDWGFIALKVLEAGKSSPVDGWAAMAHLKALPASEAARYAARSAPAAAPASPTLPAAPPSPPPAAAPPSPSAAAAPSIAGTAPAKASADEILRFDQPVPFGPFPVNGRSLDELARGVPMFPPIEGLPEELWKKECTTCHKWNQARLCDQGATYVKTARHVLRHQHPYGGAYKVALMRWAKGGCK